MKFIIELEVENSELLKFDEMLKILVNKIMSKHCEVTPLSTYTYHEMITSLQLLEKMRERINHEKETSG